MNFVHNRSDCERKRVYNIITVQNRNEVGVATSELLRSPTGYSGGVLQKGQVCSTRTCACMT